MSLADNAFRKAIAVDRHNAVASFALANLLLAQEKESEAIEFLKYTVQINPLNHVAYRKLGDLFSRRQEFDLSFYAYNMSLRIKPEHPLLHYIIGQHYLHHKKDLSRAEQSYLKSLELDPFHRYSNQAKEAIKMIEAQSKNM